jgi:predicted NBD/HSP70 family sugar kinase/biotin operon repressor
MVATSGREANRSRVLRELALLGKTSRAEIARRTGLSRTTVSSIVAELQRSGLVTEPQPENGHVTSGGRPPTVIALDAGAGVAAGIDFGKRHLAVAVSDLGHTVLSEKWRDMDEDYTAQDGIARALDLFESTLAESGASHAEVIGVGIGLPGPLHVPTGTVGSATILPGWAGVRVVEEIERRLSLPVYVENDANLGALAEGMWGSGRTCTTFVYLKVATGVGAGLITHSGLVHGAGGTAGEIGHVTVDDDGDICRCGNRGCLETLASAPAVARMLEPGLGTTLAPDEIVERARQGDPACSRALADAGRHLGAAAATLCNLFNPERIAVGGTLGAADELLLEPLRESVRLRAIASAAEDVEIVPAELGERAELLGAVALVLDKASPIAVGRANQPGGGIHAR